MDFVRLLFGLPTRNEKILQKQVKQFEYSEKRRDEYYGLDVNSFPRYHDQLDHGSAMYAFRNLMKMVRRIDEDSCHYDDDQCSFTIVEEMTQMLREQGPSITQRQKEREEKRFERPSKDSRA